MLDWDLLPDLDVEQRLAQLARWCLDADAAGRSIGLRLPGRQVPLGLGPKHLASCLEALALFDTRIAGSDAEMDVHGRGAPPR
jgi:uncharacterized protein (DUF58 family)